MLYRRNCILLLLGLLATTGSASCDLPEYRDTDVCRAKRGGGNGFSCAGPLTTTKCVWSSWHAWKEDKADFQEACPGELVRWGNENALQDCGWACFACSFIRACCDDCRTVLKVEGEWQRIRCTDAAIKVKYSWGVTTSKSSSWTRTSNWSASVTKKAQAHGVVKGIKGKVTLNAAASWSLSTTTSRSWSHSTTEHRDEEFTQPAETCSWHWKTTITDSCGEKTAKSKDFILTRGTTRGNSPCCLPGLIYDEATGKCPPDNAGNVINLCGTQPKQGNHDPSKCLEDNGSGLLPNPDCFHCGPTRKQGCADGFQMASFRHGDRCTRIECYKAFENNYIVTVGSSGTNTKTVDVDVLSCPSLVDKSNWLGGYTYSDSFSVVVSKGKITVKRLRTNIGWGMPLKFKCRAGARANYAHKHKGCVNGHNLVRWPGKSVDECAELCEARSDCRAFEYGVNHGGSSRNYRPKDCSLQSSSNSAGCDGGYNNLDLYTKKDLFVAVGQGRNETQTIAPPLSEESSESDSESGEDPFEEEEGCCVGAKLEKKVKKCNRECCMRECLINPDCGGFKVTARNAKAKDGEGYRNKTSHRCQLYSTVRETNPECRGNTDTPARKSKAFCNTM